MIVSTNKGGLANRMKSMVSVMRIANEKNIKPLVLWSILDSYQKDNHILNCPYQKLFMYPSEISKIDSNTETYNSHCLYISKKDPIPPNFSTPKTMGKVKFSFNTPNLRNIDLEYNRIPTEMIKLYLPYFRQIKLLPQLEIQINNFASNNFTPNTISLHIRSWSHPNENTRKNYQKISEYVSRYEKQMKKYPNATFYLSTDNPDIITYLKQNWNNKIITYHRKTSLKNSRSSPESIQEDLIELYLLSKNSIIIGSFGSTFTEVAWWLGNCSQNIIIV